jgi:GH24 family phage-related lysozyme (muramidase)
MRLSIDGLKLIQAWEGIEDGNPATVLLEPYICPANVYTVGWGHALTTPNGTLIDVDTFGAQKAATLAAQAMQQLFGAQAISRAQAETLLGNDVDKWSIGVTQRIGEGNATQNQFDAMVALAFNIGLGHFDESAVKRFHVQGVRKIGDVSLSSLCQASKVRAASTTMPIAFVRWSYSSDKWLLGLFRRRISEMMIYGGHDYGVSINTAKGFKG